MTGDATGSPGEAPGTVAGGPTLPEGRESTEGVERTEIVLVADTVLTPDTVLAPGWVHVAGDRVRATGTGTPASHLPRRTLTGHTILPGLVDVHCHGGGGSSYTDGDSDGAAAAAGVHRAHGTTSTVASLVTAPLDELERAVRALAELVDDGLLAGIHLEGPWLSASHCGAHDPALLRPPRADEVERLLAAGRGTITMVTLAPELAGGLDAIRRVTGHGAVAAVGHTDADYDTTRAAIDAGATVGTHLFNGMPGMHHREPGPAAALLEDERCRVELIADGHHVHGAMLRQAMRLAGQERYLLISDAIAATAAGDGRYRVGGLEVIVRDGQARVPGTGSLAGSTVTLHEALRRVTRATATPLAETASAATRTPAAVLGRTDIGTLAPGCLADLLVLDSSLDIAAVMHRGRWVPAAWGRT
ncbi:N-acetylglucosamine-6-phosphate deacetylase [Haloechinothrix sp. LS1_15]|nr:N-acetylglucosamine-6-phosphate deacetylase [Haloechinothrix sp. LS1_15]